jgi:outer membrane protein assembly factor BamB
VPIAPRTATLGLAFLAVALFLLVTGGSVPIADFDGSSNDVTLSRTWLSDTERQATGNHHAATGARIDAQGRVFAPISGGVHDGPAGEGADTASADGHATHDHAHGGHDRTDEGHDHAHGGDGDTTPTSSCGLYALNGSTGAIEWQRTVPPANCSIHSIADPTVADVTADGTPEVLATSTTETLRAYQAADGADVFARPLAAHGYTRPIVANLTASPGPEILAVDVQGNVTAFASAAESGGPARPGTDSTADRVPIREWSVDLDGFVWAEPQVVDLAGDGLSGDGRRAVAIALGDGRIVALDSDGRVAWNRSVLPGTDGLTWATSVDSEAGRSIVAASSGGYVVSVDTSGEVGWRRDLGDYAAVRATRGVGTNASRSDAAGTTPPSDPAGSTPPLVYATNRAGDLHALDARNGETVWRTSLTDADVQMTPPPSIGDVAGGPAPELVALTNDGQVHVVDPADGTILASGGRSTPIFTHATLVDLDADSKREIVVTYGDGRIARFDASGGV